MIGIYIVALAALLHLGWAVNIMISDKIYLTTPTATYFDIFRTQAAVVAALLVVSAIAFIGKLKWRESWLSLFTVIPQQIFLMLSAWSSFIAIVNGHYADGAVYSRHFIFDDQYQNIITMVLHSFYVSVLFVKLMMNTRNGSKFCGIKMHICPL